MDGKTGMKDGKAAIEQPEAATEAPVPSAMHLSIPTPDPTKPETIPPNMLGGGVMRLEVHGNREGYVRYWQNDEGDALALMVKSGWNFVERTEVQLNAAVTPRNTNLGSKISQWVGTDQRGHPMHAFLMEKPEWLAKLHNEGPGSREDYHKAINEQIQAGTLNTTPNERRYSAAGNPWAPGSPTGLPPIRSETKIVR